MQSVSVPPTGRKTCAEPTCNRSSGRSELCIRCRQQFKKTGWRTCDFCPTMLIINHTRQGTLRTATKKVSCITCAPIRSQAWCWDYDACVTCGTTSRPHMGNGRCTLCKNGYDHGERYCPCGRSVERSFSNANFLLRCAVCYGSSIRLTVAGFFRGASMASVGRETTLSELIVQKAYSFLKTGDSSLLKLKGRDIAMPILDLAYRDLTEVHRREVTNDLELLVLRHQHGELTATNELLWRLERYIRKTFKSWYLPGATFEDLVQEVVTETWRALAKWKPSQGIVWPYLKSTAWKAASTALKTATRKKHEPLTRASSLDAPRDEGDDNRTGHDRHGHAETPEAIIIPQETRAIVNPDDFAQPGTLNHALLRDFIVYGDDWSYDERATRISLVLGREVDWKSIDNARGRLQKLSNLRQLLVEAING